MYDAKGVILKQKSCRWHMTTINHIVIFQDLSFCKRTVPKLSKDTLCNLKCLVCHKLYRKKSQCNMIYFTTHSSNIPKIMKIKNHINNLTVCKQHN